MTIMEIAGDKLLPPIADLGDFLEALTKSRPSVGKEELQKHAEWTAMFGQEGA